jgi:hypothetical protein
VCLYCFGVFLIAFGFLLCRGALRTPDNECGKRLDSYRTSVENEAALSISNEKDSEKEVF